MAEDERPGLAPRVTASKQVAALTAQLAADPARLVVKFNEGTGVRVQSGLLRATTTGALPTAAGVRDRGELDVELSTAQRALSARGLRLSRLFTQSDARLADLKQRGERRARRQLGDLRLYFQIPAEHFASIAEMEELRDALNQLDSVELAYIDPRPQPAQLQGADANTPDFTSLQGYKDPAPRGIDAAYAATFQGGLGAGVSVIDVEQGWHVNHEDFPPMAYALGASDGADLDHGSAVIGVIAAPDNGFGITGITPDVAIGFSSVFTTANGGQSAGAILNAVEVLDAGDIILIEQHKPGPITADCPCNTAQCSFLPLEFWQADFDAIATATANGIIVVEAAGNGSVDFENPAYGGLLSRNTRDSGAILVGASESEQRIPMCWSNHGPRVDVHGWGQNVVTLGGGDLYSGRLGVNDRYQSNFGGTSSASPIVTGAAAALQGVALASRGEPLTPTEVRALLRATGTPQTGDLQRPIGPLPNMRAALDALTNNQPVLAAAFTVNCDDSGECTYEDASYELFGSIVAWRWTFDDGTISTARNPVHTYASFGDHLVTLTVTGNDGDTATTTGTTSIRSTVCTAREVVLFADFEAGLGAFTSSGSISRTTSAAYNGAYGARLRGSGYLTTVLDVRGWQDLTFSGWARAIGYDPGEVLYFDLCPVVNGRCDASRRVYLPSPVGSVGNDAYTFYEVSAFADLSGIDAIEVRIGGTASSLLEYAYFDDIEAAGRRCQIVECLHDRFCDNGNYCDGAERCVAGACQAGAPPCPSGSCNEVQQSCDGASGVCGDGVVDDGEECDDGNRTSGDGCSPNCTLESSACISASATLAGHTSAGRAYPVTSQSCSACWLGCSWPSGCASTLTTYFAVGSDERLGTQATAEVVLHFANDGASWSTTDCQDGGCLSDAECDDGLFCNGRETCASGLCVAAAPVSCGDGLSCTADACDEATDRCESVPNHNACDDGDPCTLDSCQLGVGCAHAPNPQCAACTASGGRCTRNADCCSSDCGGWLIRTCR